MDEEYLSSVLGDLAQRRGTVQDIQSRHDSKVLLATVPLAEMMVSVFSFRNKKKNLFFKRENLKSDMKLICCVWCFQGYSTALRTLTSGNATFSLELASYDPMNPQDQNALLNKMAGLA